MTRCSPHKLRTTLDQLDEEQKHEVVKMGFGNLFHVDCRFMGLDICLGLIKYVNVTERSLCVKGKTFHLTAADVGDVLGIPAAGGTFDMTEKVDKFSSGVEKFIGMKETELKALLGESGVSNTFKRAFLLFTLTTFLCPTSHVAPSSKLLNSIVWVKDISSFNWASIVLDLLFEEITQFNRDSKKKSIGGCLYFLKIFYFHKYPLGAAAVNGDGPLIKLWTNKKIQERIQYERKNKEGLLTISKEEIINLHWINSTFKDEVTKSLFTELVDRLVSMLLLVDAVRVDMLNRLKEKGGPSSSCGQGQTDPSKEKNEGEDDGHGEKEESESEKVGDEAAGDVAVQGRQARDPNKVKEGVRRIPKHKSKTCASQHPAYLPGLSQRQTNKALRDLYIFCIRKPDSKFVGNRVLVELWGTYLERTDCHTMKVNGWVSNTVMSFAAQFMMETQKKG